MTVRALPFIALIPLVAGTAAAQTTSVPRPGPGFTSGPATRLAPAWGFRAYVNEDFALKPTDPGQCEPAPDLGLVVCGVKTGEVIALTMSGGEPAWVFRTRGGVRARPVIADGALYAGSSDGCLYRLDPRTGKTTWKAPFCTDAAVYGSPAVAGGLVYFPVTVNKLYAVSEATGQFAWEHHRDRPRFMSAEGVASPVVEGARVYVGYSDGSLVALDRANGKVAWTTELGRDLRQTDVDTTPVIDGDVIYAAAFGEGPAAVRVADGSVAWRGRWFGSTRPEVVGDLLVFGTSDGEVVAVRKSDGGAVWLTRLDGGAAYPPVLLGDVVVAGGDRGLYALEARTGAPIELLAIPNGVRTVPALWGRRLFFVGGGGTVGAADVQAR